MLRIGASVTRTKPVPERTAYALCLSQVPPAHPTPGRRGARPTRGPCCPLLSISGGATEGPGAGDGGTLAKGNQWARGRAAGMASTGFWTRQKGGSDRTSFVKRKRIRVVMIQKTGNLGDACSLVPRHHSSLGGLIEHSCHPGLRARSAHVRAGRCSPQKMAS